MRKSWALALSAFIAVVSTVLIVLFTEHKTKPEPTVPVVVFSAAVSDREPIQEDQIKVVSYPASLAPQDYFSDPSQVIGKVPKYPTESGQIVLESSLRDESFKNGVREGKVLVGVPVDLITSSGVLKVGDMVHVAIASSGEVALQGPIQARILYRDLRVMALKNQQGEDVNVLKEQETSEMPAGGDTTPSVVTLEASSEQATELFLASQQGPMALFVDPWANTQ